MHVTHTITLESQPSLEDLIATYKRSMSTHSSKSNRHHAKLIFNFEATPDFCEQLALRIPFLNQCSKIQFNKPFKDIDSTDKRTTLIRSLQLITIRTNGPVYLSSESTHPASMFIDEKTAYIRKLKSTILAARQNQQDHHQQSTYMLLLMLLCFLMARFTERSTIGFSAGLIMGAILSIKTLNLEDDLSCASESQDQLINHAAELDPKYSLDHDPRRVDLVKQGIIPKRLESFAAAREEIAGITDLSFSG